MRKFLAILAFMGVASSQAMAYEHYRLMPLEPLKLKVDSMPTSLSEMNRSEWSMSSASKPAMSMSTNGFFSDKGVDVKPYTFREDMTYAGVPLFIAGIIAKGEKASFRQNNPDAPKKVQLLTNFHTEIDNYTQFAPFALSTVLNFAGVEGRSDHTRYLASSAMAYAIMAGIVNPIKYSASEMRPDGSTRNSWPSGHTATAFVSATILHKEYGLTRSPWYSVAGYGVATATGIMRVLNNRHWVSDVLSGAGIGILSTELAYGISDLIFKGRHLNRGTMPITADVIERPSFFSISMGIGLGSRNMTFNGEDLGLIADDSYNNLPDNPTEDDYANLKYSDVNLKFAPATVVGVEGAYFFNKYIGVGGRLRVKSSPIKGWSDVTNKERAFFEDLLKDDDKKDDTPTTNQQESKEDEWISKADITIESDHITEFTADVGLYFNLPLSRRLALGSKLLIGRSVIQDLDVNAHFAGTALDGKATDLENLGFGDKYDVSWDYLTVSGNNTMKYGTGLSLTYAYKSNFSWKVFVDYDFTRKRYTMEYNPFEFLKKAWPDESGDDSYAKTSSTIKKNMNSFVLGCSFTVSF